MGPSSLTRSNAREGGRTHFIQELERTRDETLKCFSLNHGDLARTYAPGKWSVGHILHHLSDSETVFFDRIRRVLSEPRPQVPLEVSRHVFESVRNAIIYYAGEHYERSGHLEFVHSVDGVRTLRDEFDKVAAHNEHHLSQVRLALGRPAA